MSLRNKDHSTALLIIGTLAMFAAGFGLIIVKLWVIGSLLTSSVKAVSDKCDHTYAVESFVSGNWFCPIEK